jgi:hypothetical protein
MIYNATNGALTGLMCGFAMTAPVMLLTGHPMYAALSAIDFVGMTWILSDRNNYFRTNPKYISKT